MSSAGKYGKVYVQATVRTDRGFSKMYCVQVRTLSLSLLRSTVLQDAMGEGSALAGPERGRVAAKRYLRRHSQGNSDVRFVQRILADAVGSRT